MTFDVLEKVRVLGMVAAPHSPTIERSQCSSRGQTLVTRSVRFGLLPIWRRALCNAVKHVKGERSTR